MVGVPAPARIMDDLERPPRILVIDDDEACARLLEVAFRRTRAEVVRQSRSFGALSRVAEVQPVAVILDVTMPGLDGPSIVELLRADPELSGTRVILWSALPREDLERRAAECGADAFYEKVASASAFVTQVASWLAQWDGVDLG